MFLGMTVTWWTVGNAALCLFGITVALLSSHWLPGKHDNTVEVENIGWVYVVIAGWCTTFSLMITMKYVRTLPVSIVTCFRVVFGVLAYQLLMVIFEEKSDKWDSLKVWRVIVPYAFIYVFLVQVLLLTALKKARPLSVSVGTNCTFFLSLVFAAAIVQEYPSTPELIGSTFIGVSIISAMYEIVCRHRAEQKEEDLRVTMGLDASFGDRSLLGDNRSKEEGSDDHGGGRGGGARRRSSRTSRSTATLADRLISVEGGSSVYSFYEDRISSWAVEG